MSTKQIGIIVGSLRRNSFSRAVAKALTSLAPENLSLRIIEIGDLPMFNQDFDEDGNTPESWTRFRNEIKALDGFIFVTPEYNRSFPAVIKNAIDIGSRPYGSNAWDGKAGGIISVTPGSLGAFGANHQLRQPMVFLNVLMMQQPEAYISNIAEAVNEKGEVTSERTLDHLKNYLEAFSQWVNKVSAS
ncbi:NADPH-dependent FMN reductase [Lacrimispora sp. JR3]|uniref:NADPH-dependent FMN reductase n=1 Tax=Lacrimispora sinapis TaxID=3111456 RepID=UPI00374A1E16